MMGVFTELVNRRESCRNFAPKPVENEKLRVMVETARLAPSACNSQPWNFLVVNNPELSRKLAKCTQGMGMNQFTDNCPAFIVVSEYKANLSAKLGGLVKEQQYAQIDIGIAAAHLCFAALEQGLSTCILGWFNEEKIKELFSLPKDKRIRLVVAVGYAENGQLRPKRRKDLDEIAAFLT